MKITNKLKVMLKSILSLQLGEVATDKAVLKWDGEEQDLAEGMEVFVEGEDGELIPAPDGDYTTEDGKVISVVEGKVASIKDPEAEVAPEEPIEEVTDIDEQAEEEVPAPADEEEKPAEEEPTEEDRIAAIEDKINAITEALNQMVNAMAALEGRIAEVEGKLAKVEAPQADPIDETPVEEEKKTRLSYLRKD